MLELPIDIENLSPNQRKIADYIEKNGQRILLMTEQEIADEVKLSIASVSRFWKAAGYRNLKDFKQRMKDRLEVTPAKKLSRTLDHIEGAGFEPQQQLLQISVQHIEETMKHFDHNQFQQAVQTISAGRRIYLYGPGPSKGLAELMHFRMSRFGLDMRYMPASGHDIYETLLHVTQEDVIVLFGFIRMLPEARVIYDYAAKTGCKTILITDRLVSDFTGKDGVSLYASRGEVWEFHSMIAPLFIVENLIIGVGMKNKEQSLSMLEELSMLRKTYEGIIPRT
ncbi:MurR/RpiR family transcriptional regulator [Marinicrinis lubricantis]|uniref:MurR/RpiR family transcriptional regulator n=1 Tax=Marinicrinis lubricantis TaxID=2086470 RepID=A0ABW1IP69_9BACL